MSGEHFQGHLSSGLQTVAQVCHFFAGHLTDEAVTSESEKTETVQSIQVCKKTPYIMRASL